VAVQLTVLIVEDEAETRELTAEIFQARQFNVLVAESVTQAAKILQTNKPSMILLDIAMPGGDGHELLRKIKSDPALTRIPVVLVTGSPRDAFPEDASLALAVFRKPFDVPKLAQLVQTFCDRMAANSG
jgi:CheY-like chemotaxis protein